MKSFLILLLGTAVLLAPASTEKLAKDGTKQTKAVETKKIVQDIQKEGTKAAAKENAPVKKESVKELPADQRMAAANQRAVNKKENSTPTAKQKTSEPDSNDFLFRDLRDKSTEITNDGEPLRFLIVLAALLVSCIVSKLTAMTIRGIAKKIIRGDLSTLIGNIIARPAAGVVLFMLAYLSVLPYLSMLSDKVFAVAEHILTALVCAMFAWVIYRSVELVDYAFKRCIANGTIQVDELLIQVIRRILQVVIVVLSVLFIGQNILNMNITALLAGAGVIGLAVAFAGQDTVANFFGSVMLIIDRPFNVNDFVTIDSYSGTITKVGLRSTRMTTLDGFEITIPNKSAAGVPITNITRRGSIKNVIQLGLTYDTTPEKMKRAMEILHEILDHHEGMSPDQPPKIHFTEFKDYSLNIQVLIWFHPANVMKNFDFMNHVNLEILTRFNREGLDFAFPSSTTYLAYDSKRKLSVEITGTKGA